MFGLIECTFSFSLKLSGRFVGDMDIVLSNLKIIRLCNTFLPCRRPVLFVGTLLSYFEKYLEK